ncbi:hypothetical protein AcW1_003706 [Taiwanofungus camphoratus]|nr:hypothetical protein AcW1_003706 [Antrodia cinnamomea]
MEGNIVGIVSQKLEFSDQVAYIERRFSLVAVSPFQGKGATRPLALLVARSSEKP